MAIWVSLSKRPIWGEEVQVDMVLRAEMVVIEEFIEESVKKLHSMKKYSEKKGGLKILDSNLKVLTTVVTVLLSTQFTDKHMLFN